MDRTSRRMGLVAGVFALALLAAACGGGANAGGGGGGGGDLWVKIAAPKDHAKVGEPFTLDLQASVPIGAPDTGDHHVHVCFDGASCDTKYTLAYGDTLQIDGLTPGTHTIEASLRNADHSDAGPTDSITVTVTGTATTTSPSPAASPSSSGGYGY